MSEFLRCQSKMTKAVALFLRLKEEYQSIRWLATTNTTSREQKLMLS